MMQRIPGRTLIQAGGAVSLVANAGLAVILGATDHVTTWGLLGPLLLNGVGMGLFIVPAFDTIISAVTDAETGSAAGVLNAIQQLGGAIGVAVLGSVFFSVLSHDGFAVALRDTLWWEVVSLGVMLLVSPLLPGRAVRPGGAGAEAPASASLLTAGPEV